jgi:hypothetical protein
VQLVHRLFATQVALDSRDLVFWLALSRGSRVVPLALVEAVVVVALGEALVLLILLVSPSLHHVTKLHGSLGAVASKVAVDVLHGEAILEAVDDVLVGDVGDGGAHLEEVPGVGPQGLVLLLLDL